MKFLTPRVRRQAPRLFAIAAIFAVYGFTRLPHISDSERASLASQFAFTRLPLPEIAGSQHRSYRDVHPSLEKISAWVSSVGAAAALYDIDGDGLANDVCYVDPRTDQVIIGPVSGTGNRYPPLHLQPPPSQYDPSTVAPMGCLPGDFNEDGRADLLIYYWGRPPVIFLKNAANGRPLNNASWRPCEVVTCRERWFTNAATQADLDGDGHLDLIIGNYFQDDAHILDFDGTGSEAMQRSMSRAFNGGRNRILRWTGASAGPDASVSFEDTDAGLDSEVLYGWALAVGAADLDGDLLPEVYFAHDFGPDRLLHNRSEPGDIRLVPVTGVKTWNTPNSKVLGRDSFKGMGVEFCDLNGDNLPDILVSNIAAIFSLEESHFAFLSTGESEAMRNGRAPYVDASETIGLSRSGWGWDIKSGDFNNDGVLEVVQATGFVKGDVNRWPELHELAMGNDELLTHPQSWFRMQPGDDLSGHQRNPFYVRASDGRYYDLSKDIGVGEPSVTRAIATADVDGDGDLDFVTGNQWEPSFLYRNDSPSEGAFLGLHLLLPIESENRARTYVRSGHPGPDTPGSPAIGAAVTVELPSGERVTEQVDGGSGHSGVRSPELHFGLGDLGEGTELSVTVRWRDRNGEIRRTAFAITPGWYTVVLGREIEQGA